MPIVHFCALRHSASMAESTRRKTLNYITFVMDHLKVSASGLARLAGIAPTTLTRPLKDENHPFTLSTSTLEKIRAASGVDFAPFMAREMDTIARTLDFFNRGEEYHPDDVPSGKDDTHERMTTVMGEVAAGLWREQQFGTTDVWGVFIVLGDPKLRKHALGLVVRGESLNKVAQDGEVIICESITETGTVPRDNDIVIVERQRGDLIEVTAKRLRKKEGSIELWPESTDPRYQQPIVVGENDGETVKIIGLAHYVVRQL